MPDVEQAENASSQTPLLREGGRGNGNRSSRSNKFRRYLQWFLKSKYGHYFVMILVTLDVAGIFADFLISLHVCEHRKDDTRGWETVITGLGILSLVFSCLFMGELVCTIYAFGPR